MQYLFHKQFSSSTSQTFLACLKIAHESGHRPLCICKPPGIAMGVAKVEGTYIIKRLPNTGAKHAAHCEHFSPPPELSGLGHVMGSAIKVDAVTSSVSLRLAFSLSKLADPMSRDAEPPGEASADETVANEKGNTTKLSMRGLLHYLWDEAQLTHWGPDTAAARDWFIVRRSLLSAIESKSTKTRSLSDAVFIPEKFKKVDREDIRRRRDARLAPLKCSAKPKKRPLMIVIGVLKGFEQRNSRSAAVILHMPDFPFYITEDLLSRIRSRFQSEFDLAERDQSLRRIVCATFFLDSAGAANIVDLSLLVVDENWIPVEDANERMLVSALVQANRKFIKSLRVNLPTGTPVACALLQDTSTPTAAYIIPGDSSAAYRTVISAMRKSSALASMTWDTGQHASPEFPPRMVGDARSGDTAQLTRRPGWGSRVGHSRGIGSHNGPLSS